MKIPHLEDLVFLEDRRTIQDIMAALIMRVSGQRVGHLGLKFDGICLVFGNKDGFFLSDQGYFNKKQRLFRSSEEIMAHNFPDAKKGKLLRAFEVLKNAPIRNGLVLYADWLFDSETVLEDDTFQPNIIKYASPSKTYRREYASYKLGLAVHTQEYCGVVMPSSYSPVMLDVLFVPTDMSTMTLNSLDSYTELYDYLGMLSDPHTKATNIAEMRKELNNFVRKKAKYSFLDLWLSPLFPEKYARNLDILINFKYNLLGYMEEQVDQYGLFDCFINDQPSGHEGFVFRYNDKVVKLVDRYKFSKKNFDPSVSRGWQSAKLQRVSAST